MPNNTFLNLDKDKQDILINASIKEFSTYTFEEASINRIIHDINMPRGSFYMYFDNKEELYHYIISIKFSPLKAKIKDIIKTNNGDIIDSFINIFDYIIEYCNRGCNKTLVKNFFIGLNYHMECKVLDKSIITHNKERLRKFLNSIDTSKLKSTEIDEIFIVFDLIITLLMHSLMDLFIVKLDVNFVKDKYIKQLNIIKKSIYKEG